MVCVQDAIYINTVLEFARYQIGLGIESKLQANINWRGNNWTTNRRPAGEMSTFARGTFLFLYRRLNQEFRWWCWNQCWECWSSGILGAGEACGISECGEEVCTIATEDDARLWHCINQTSTSAEAIMKRLLSKIKRKCHLSSLWIVLLSPWAITVGTQTCLCSGQLSAQHYL